MVAMVTVAVIRPAWFLIPGKGGGGRERKPTQERDRWCEDIRGIKVGG